MGSKSNYLEKKLLDGVLGGPDFVRPGTVHIALFTTGTLSEDGTGAVEVSGGGYTRLAVTNTATEFPASSGSPSKKTNANLLLFPTATADWGTVTQWAIYDAGTTGNMLYYGTFASSRLIQTGDTATVAAGALSITED